MVIRTPRKLIAFAGGPVLVAALVAFTGAPASAGSGGLVPPSDLEVTEVDHTNATIAWDESPEADSYTVFWTPAPPPEWMGTIDTEALTASFPVTSPGARHYVTVMAIDGSRLASATISFDAPDAPPPEAPPTPEDVHADVAPGSVEVAWDPSVVDGEEADSYLIEWASDEEAVVTTGTSLSREIPQGSDELAVTVSARNGFDERSDPSDPLPVDVPPATDWEEWGAPTDLEVVADEDGDITAITWDRPTGGADPVTYRLNYHFADQEFESPIAQNDEPFIDVPAQIGDLVVCAPDSGPGQTWVIWVTAHAHDTTSPRSEETTICLA